MPSKQCPFIGEAHTEKSHGNGEQQLGQSRNSKRGYNSEVNYSDFHSIKSKVKRCKYNLSFYTILCNIQIFYNRGTIYLMTECRSVVGKGEGVEFAIVIRKDKCKPPIISHKILF